MDGQFLSGRWTLLLDPVSRGKRWRYEGIGLPRSRAELRPRVLGVVVVVALTIWGYASIAPNGRLEPGLTHQHRTDFTVFTEAGAAFFDGRDPYRVTNPRGWHYLYPPLFALMVAPLSIFDTVSQVVIWYVVNVTLSFLCVAEARRLWRLVAGADSRRFLWVAGLASLAMFLPFLDCMQAGQLGIAILYLLMRGFRCVLRDQSRSSWFLGGLILALPAVIKLVPSFPVAVLLLQRWSAVAARRSDRRLRSQAVTLTAGFATGVFLFLLAIPASLVGWRANLNYLADWRARVVTNERVGFDSNFNIHSGRNQSLANGLYLGHQALSRAFGWDSHVQKPHKRRLRIVQPAAHVSVGVVLVALLLACRSLGRQNERLDQTIGYGLACCASLLVSPLSWGHYYMAQALAVLFVPIWLLRRGRSTEAKVVAVIPPILSWSHYLAMPYTGEFGLLGLGTTIWFVGVCGLIIRREVVVALAAVGPHFYRRRLGSLASPVSSVMSLTPVAGASDQS